MSNASTPKPSEAIAYLRVASIDQTDQSAVLQRQFTTCQQFARNQGVAITRVYADVGVSGRRLRRPALDRVLHRLTLGQSGYLIMADDRRLACDPVLSSALEAELKRHSITIISSPFPPSLQAPAFLPRWLSRLYREVQS